MANLDSKELEVLDRLEKEIKSNNERVGNAVDQAMAECKRLETIHGKTSEDLTKHITDAKKWNDENGDKFRELRDRMQGIEHKIGEMNAPIHGGGDELKSPGRIVIESDAFKIAQKAGASARSMDPVEVGAFLTKNFIGSPTTSNAIGILAPNDRVPGLIRPADRLMTIRNLLPVVRTSSAIVEYAAENVFTNAAAPQGASASPAAQEGEEKAQSDITFTYGQKPVTTLAHWIAASRQVLSDAAMLQDYIDGRLRYGLALEEEDQIINGDGTGQALSGLATNATAYSQNATADTKLDTVLKAMHQCALSEYSPDSLVLSKGDWVSIMLLKDSQNRYLFGDPAAMTQNTTIWGLPYVATNSMSAGKFFVANFALAATLFDREQTTVRVSEHHSNFFTRNLVAILAEERVCLIVFRAAAIIYGTFPA